MTRRMSVSMTLPAVHTRSKTVTRRHVDTWKNLKPGDRLTLIEKGMGLPEGAKQVVVAEVEVVGVTVEPIGMVTPTEVRREGMWGQAIAATQGTTTSTAEWFIRFWLQGHRYPNLHPEIAADVLCRRIEWRYLDEVAS